MPRATVLAVPPVSWMLKLCRRAAFLQAFLLHQAADLVGLAAQPDQQQRAEVGMPRVAAERAPQDLQRLAFAVGGAAGAVSQRDHAVDIRVALQRARVDVAAEMVGDGPRHRGRAVDAGEHADVVARGHAAIGAHDALEGGRLGHVGGGRDALPHRMVAREVAELQVVAVHMLAGRDVHPRHADHLVVAPHRLAGGDGAHRQLVARRHQAGDGDAFAVDARAAQQLHACDDHVVRGMDADHRQYGSAHGAGVRSRSAPGPRRARSAAARPGLRCRASSRRRASGTPGSASRPCPRPAACRW